jgi:hypothetical protein
VLLSKAIGIDIFLEKHESSVGGFSVDIFAAEGRRRYIVEDHN